MKDTFSTNSELIEEISLLKQRIKELEQSEQDRKKSEETLRGECERLELAMDAGGHGFWDWHLDTNEAYFSPSYYTMMGYEPGEFPPNFQSWLNLLHPDDHGEVVPRINRYVEKTQSYEEEFRLRCKDGSWRWISGRGKFFRKGAAAPDRAIGVHVDITERKKAEEKLQESEAKYRSLFENAIEGIFQTTPDGRFLSANPALAKIFGYNSPQKFMEQITDIDRQHYVNPEDRQTYKNILEREGVIKGFEKQLINKNGNPVWASLSARAVRDEEDAIIYYEGTLEDITTRKQAEEEKRIMQERLQHADKMEAIGTLAGGIAHDFNNLLMGIQGYASLILLDIDPSDPHYEKLKRIEEQVQSGAVLTRQLLGFARGGRYEVKPVNMNEVIKKTSAMFGRTRKEITIHRKYEKNVWVIEADQGQIEQVLLNLYLNAWHAMPAGGDLSIETKNIVVGKDYANSYSMIPGRYLQISISDTGVGMDEKTKERIFEPFFTTKELGRGTGLGLAMVYGITKNHNGFIDVTSKPGHGTAFVLYFPASEKGVAKEKPTVPESIKGTETILLIDDEPDVLAVSKAILESLGYSVYAFKNGEEATELYKQKMDEIGLVVLDMIMPGLSGSETFDRIMELNTSAKIILSSGYSLNDQAQQIMNKGCLGFIQKPFDIVQLSRKVREVLEK
jgi:PAS domain S-box-containing protein